MATDDKDKLSLVAETATVQKQGIVTGRVRISTHTRTEEELVSTLLDREDVSVERVPVDQEVDAAPAVRTEGDTTIVPVVEEVLVVEKRLRVREELHIRRTVSQDAVEVPVTLRKQAAEVHRDDLQSKSEEEI
ncbi:MAG TPA: YsnF/AvaK domain-containing protein [Devosia sp.]|jgi:uncharacterized protein (TIGR02271 family)|nr:YsnF/AvaK domain-containing protein [Devosia sp.]